MITCAANGCPSTQTTKIDGNQISFFAFPEDDLRKNQWLHNCNLASGVVHDTEPMHLCELHFEKINFTSSNDLKSNAVPTLFGRIEEPPKQHPVEEILQTSPEKPVKQRKLDEHTLVTPPQSPFMQDNVEDAANPSNADASIDHDVLMNGFSASTPKIHEHIQTKPKLYRLVIQIDKIRSKPGPKCKKRMPLMMPDIDIKDSVANEIEKKGQSLQSLTKKACAKGSCKLRKCVYNLKPALQCEVCEEYYVTKDQEDKSYSCSICSKTFSNPQSLYVHVRNHFICDTCQTECNSQTMYEKHIKLHISSDPSYPYKCHQCNKIFDLKEGVKQHCLMEHSKVKLQNTLLQVTSPSVAAMVAQHIDYHCATCNISFRNDQTYRNHMSSHKTKEGLRYNISEANNIIPVPDPLTGSQIGILQPVKFSCRVCSKQFDNVGEVDIHTRTHLEEEAEDELKCHICKKCFKSSAVFSEHLKHHLSRAYPCPICSKAFINRTTLKIHLKTHESASIETTSANERLETSEEKYDFE